MDGIFIRGSFIVSLCYILISQLTGGDYRIYLMKGIVIFLSCSLVFIIIHYLVLKILAEAKFKVVSEDFYDNYKKIKNLRKERMDGLRKKLLAEKEAKASKTKLKGKKE